MGKPNPADVVFWLLAVIAAAVFGLFVLVLGGAVPIGSAPEAEAERVVQEAQPEDQPDGLDEPGVVRRPGFERNAPGTSTAEATTKPATELVTVVVTATRGDCWLAARAGSENGPVLEERILLQGESVRLRATRVWLSLGAASNVDVFVDQEPREVPAGTVAVVLAPSSTS